MGALGSAALATTASGPGGVWRHIEDLGIALQHDGIEVVIALPAGAERLQAAAAAVGLRWQSLHEAVRRRDLDIWHMHLHDTYDRHAFGILARRHRLGGTVITEHLPHSGASDATIDPENPHTAGTASAKTIFKRAEFSLASEVIAVGSSSARFLESRYRLRAGQISTVRNGVALRPEPVAARPEQPIRVAAVGSVIYQKGYDVLVEAVQRSSREWTVAIYGTGPHLDALRRSAAEIPNRRITFHGWADRPLEHLAAADVVCMPSRWESCPYVALEAGSLGRAVVGSRVDGLDEIVVPEETGLLVAPNRPDALALALDRIAGDPGMLPRWGIAAYEHIRRHYTLDRMIGETLEVYRRAAR